MLKRSKSGVFALALAMSLGLVPTLSDSQKAFASTNSYVPQLNVYRSGNSAKIEVGIDMADEDVVSRMSYETNETMPILTYQPNNGNQSFSADTAFSGSRSEKITNTITGHTGNHWAYPGTQADTSYTSYGSKYAPNNSWFSVSYKVKQVGGTKASTGLFLDAGSLSKGLPMSDNSGHAVKFSQAVDFRSPPATIKVYTDSGAVNWANGAWVLPCLGKGTNYDWDAGWYTFNSATQELVRDSSLSGSFVDNGRRSVFNAGEQLLSYNEADIGLSNRTVVADNQWHTFSANGKLVNDNYDYATKGFVPALDWGTDATAYIDDVKFGYASIVNVFKDGVQIYSDYGSDITDASIAIKPNQPQVSGVSVGKGSMTVNFTDSNKSESHTYTANSVSNSTGAVSMTSNPVTLTMTSNIVGYSYVIDNNAGTVPSNTLMTTSTSLNADTSNVDFSKPVYVHLKAIDTNGIESDVTHYAYSNSTAQTSAQAKTSLASVLANLSVTNDTTQASLLGVLNSSVDTGYITLGITGFSLTPSTETANGSLTGTLRITDKFGAIETLPIDLVVTQLNQSVGTIADLYTKSLAKFIATNGMSANDIKNSVNVPYADVTVSIENYALVPATDTSSGSVVGQVKIVQGGTTRLVPINLTISYLPQELSTAVRLVQDKLNTYQTVNSTPYNEILNTVSGVITNSIIHVSWDVDNSQDMVKTEATEYASGSMKGTMIVTDGTLKVNVPVDLVIAQLHQTVKGTKPLLEASLNSFKATNSTTDADVLASIRSNLTNASITANFGTSTGQVFNKVSATEDSDGAITGLVVVTDGSSVLTVPVNLKIDKLNLTLDSAKARAEALIGGITPSNATTQNDILNKLKDILSSNISANYPKDLVITPATEYAKGSITGTVKLSDGTTAVEIPINLVIDKLPQTSTEAKSVIDATLPSMVVSNSTTKDDILKFINSAIASDVTATFGTGTKDFTKTDATSRHEGTITGTIILTDAKGNVVEAPISLKIPLISTGSTGTGSGSGSGSSGSSHNSGGSSSGSGNAKSDGSNTDVATGTNGASSKFDSLDTKTLMSSDSSSLGSIKVTKVTNQTTVDGLNLLGSNLTGLSISTYKWEAYKDTSLVNQGLLNVVSKDNKCLGVFLDANSPLDKETQIDINIPDTVVTDLSKVYIYNNTLNKYANATSNIVHINDKYAFKGTNKNKYVITSDSVNPALLATQGWNKAVNPDPVQQWAYLQGEDCITGWKQDTDKRWYYMNDTELMRTGWLKDNSNWYYLNKSGAMTTGWQNVDGTWYFMYSDGAMAHDTSIDGYNLDSSGALI